MISSWGRVVRSASRRPDHRRTAVPAAAVGEEGRHPFAWSVPIRRRRVLRGERSTTQRRRMRGLVGCNRRSVGPWLQPTAGPGRGGDGSVLDVPPTTRFAPAVRAWPVGGAGARKSPGLREGRPGLQKWCQRAGLNCRPRAYESPALPLSYSGEKQERLVCRSAERLPTKISAAGPCRRAGPASDRSRRTPAAGDSDHPASGRRRIAGDWFELDGGGVGSGRACPVGDWTYGWSGGPVRSERSMTSS